MSDKDEATLRAHTLLERAYALQTSEAARELYDDWASTYDHTMIHELGYLTPGRTCDMLADHLQDRSARILDVGCGTGLAGEALQTLGFTQVDALDRSAAMLEVARARAVYQHCFEADLLEPLDMIDSGQYQAVVCTGTFTHAHVGAACLPELLRVLGDDGMIACTVHHDIWESAGFDKAIAELSAGGQLLTRFQQAGPYFNTSSTSDGDYLIWQKCH